MKQIVHSPESLAAFLRRVRKFKHLTQSMVGEGSFKIDQTTVSSIEQGAKGTRLDAVFRLLASLDLELIVQDKKLHKNNKEKEQW